MTKQRYYYAAHSYMGLNYTYDSPCWVVYVFPTKQERDLWVDENEYDQSTGNYVAEAISCDTARKIAPDLRRYYAFKDCHRVIDMSEIGWERKYQEAYYNE